MDKDGSNSLSPQELSEQLLSLGLAEVDIPTLEKVFAKVLPRPLLR